MKSLAIYTGTRVLCGMLMLVGALCAQRPAAAQQSESPQPNIVFILADDLGWNGLSIYGHDFHETPNLDRLASEGMLFTDAYAAAPVCSPTRASIQSGQYPAHVGVTDFIPGHWRPYERVIVPRNRTQYLPTDVVTVGEALKSAGYKTGYFGKWHLGDPKMTPDERGYDEHFVFRGFAHLDIGDELFPPQDVDPKANLTQVIADRGIRFLEEHRDEPFFLTLAHFAVHTPLEAEPELIEKYEAKPKPESGVNNPIYAAMMESLDRSVGRVMDALDRLGLSEETVVVFYSDNGGLIERFDKADGVIVSTNYPLRSGKGDIYEGGLRVPLIVRWPGVVQPSSVSDALVSSVDLYPTFVEMAGASTHAGRRLDGISLVPLLGGENPDADRTIFFHYPHYHRHIPASAVRQGAYKLTEFLDDGRLELYNLRTDIGEENDLSTTLPEKTRELHALLDAWRQSVGAELPVPNPDFDVVRREEWGWHPDRTSPPEYLLDSQKN